MLCNSPTSSYECDEQVDLPDFSLLLQNHEFFFKSSHVRNNKKMHILTKHKISSNSVNVMHASLSKQNMGCAIDPSPQIQF